MRELMLLCAKANVVCRQRRGQVWLAAANAKRGFLVSIEEAPALVAHGPRMYSVALAQGLTPCRG
jgi:hypothetical protein